VVFCIYISKSVYTVLRKDFLTLPKVTNPLGSGSASGQIGKMLIFQGTTVKNYKAPKINKSEAQLSAEDRFADVNKTLRALKGWGRAALETLFGRNWMAFGYQGIVTYWAENLAAWGELSGGDQAEWASYAPVASTRLDKGQVFFCCAQGLNSYLIDGNYFQYEFFEVGEVNAQGSRDWWDRTLEGVFLTGVFDQENTDLVFTLPGTWWVLVNDASAYEGSYRQSVTSSPVNFVFWFYGAGFGIFYKQTASLAGLAIETDLGNLWTISQNDPTPEYQVEWRSPAMVKGLHRVTGMRTGAVGAVNVDAIAVYG
jgi:hypothetical protein